MNIHQFYKKFTSYFCHLNTTVSNIIPLSQASTETHAFQNSLQFQGLTKSCAIDKDAYNQLLSQPGVSFIFCCFWLSLIIGHYLPIHEQTTKDKRWNPCLQRLSRSISSNKWATTHQISTFSSNKKELQNEDKIKFWYLYFLVEIYRFLQSLPYSKHTPMNSEHLNKWTLGNSLWFQLNTSWIVLTTSTTSAKVNTTPQ